MKEGRIFFFQRIDAGEERCMFRCPGSVNEDSVSLEKVRNRRGRSGVRGAAGNEGGPFPPPWPDRRNKIGVVFLYYVGNELILNIYATCFPLSGCRPEARKATPEFLLGISLKGERQAAI